MRTIRRLAYDGNYRRSIELLVDKVENQQTVIKSLTELIKRQEQRIIKLERKIKITDNLVVQPILEEKQEEFCLESVLKEGTKTT